MAEYRSLEWRDGVLRMLDQRRLPEETVYLDLTEPQQVADAIRDMVVRGAPAIGAAAAYGLALAAFRSQAENVEALRRDLAQAAETLKAARPTAANLFWAVQRVLTRAADPSLRDPEALRKAVLAEAHAIAQEDAEVNRRIAEHALRLIPDQARVIHHCNTGGLATVEYGTALGVIRGAHEAGKQIHVYVDETRPRLQGAKLTAWELKQLGIPHTVIVDSASGHFMRTVGIDLCLVGADRVAANGDTANKIGTYNLALVAYAHGVPFYVCAPTSTIDLSIPDGDHIVIEERPEEEVIRIGETRLTPEGVHAANPAFDVTPARYITAIITEEGVAYPPYEESLRKMVEAAEARRRERQEAAG